MNEHDTRERQVDTIITERQWAREMDRRQEAMTDTTQDHAAPRASALHAHAHITGDAIRYTLQAVQGHVTRLEDIADTLVAERDALRRYARRLEREVHAISGRDTTYRPAAAIAELRATTGVADLLTDREGTA